MWVLNIKKVIILWKGFSDEHINLQMKVPQLYKDSHNKVPNKKCFEYRRSWTMANLIYCWNAEMAASFEF